LAVDNRIGTAHAVEECVSGCEGRDAGTGLFEQFLDALCSQMVMLTAPPPSALRLSLAALPIGRGSGSPDKECASLR